MTTKEKIAHHAEQDVSGAEWGGLGMSVKWIGNSLKLLRLNCFYIFLWGSKTHAHNSIKHIPIGFQRRWAAASDAHKSLRLFQFVTGFFRFRFNQSSGKHHLFYIFGNLPMQYEHKSNRTYLQTMMWRMLTNVPFKTNPLSQFIHPSKFPNTMNCTQLTESWKRDRLIERIWCIHSIERNARLFIAS